MKTSVCGKSVKLHCEKTLVLFFSVWTRHPFFVWLVIWSQRWPISLLPDTPLTQWMRPLTVQRNAGQWKLFGTRLGGGGFLHVSLTDPQSQSSGCDGMMNGEAVQNSGAHILMPGVKRFSRQLHVLKNKARLGLRGLIGGSVGGGTEAPWQPQTNCKTSIL